jgi:hypothetical protein
MWISFALTPNRVRAHLARGVSIVRETDLLSAAGYLCSAADNLRAIGLLALADEVEAFIATLDAEILLATLTDD